MILNLSYFEEDIVSYLNKNSDTDPIIDLTGVVNSSITQNVFQNVRAGKEIIAIEERAIANYVSFCGNLSRLSTGKGNIRDLRVEGFPVYWVTDIAVKHYEIHWLSAVFFLEQLLKEQALVIPDDEVVKVIVPKSALHGSQLINEVFKKNGLRKPQIISRGQNSEVFYLIRFVKEVLLNLFGLFKLKQYLKRQKRREASLKGQDILIVNIYASLWDRAKWENYWSEHYNYFSSKAPTWVTPFFNRYSGSQSYDFSKAPDEFLTTLPCFSIALSIGFQIVSVYIKSFFYLKGNNRYIGVEVRKGLASIGYFLSYAWYKKFAAQQPSSCLAVYDEEMYYAGRVLSHAFNAAANPKVNYCGLQHGLFFNPNHTVYTVSDKEITDVEKGDGFPLPQRFIVWGDFFKESFLLNNSLPNDFPITLGSIKHSSDERAFVPQRKSKGNMLNVLWCTTLVHFAKAEFDVMREAFRRYGAQINLVIRKHPYVHLPDETLQELFSGIPLSSLSFSGNRNIKEDMANADIVISTSGSTTFLDALLSGKNSVRIYNHASYPAMHDVLTTSSFFIYTSGEFANLLQALVSNLLPLDRIGEEEMRHFIYTVKDKWGAFIDKVLALDQSKSEVSS